MTKEEEARRSPANSSSGEWPLAVGDCEVGFAMLRIALGVNIFMHGVARLGSVSGFVDGVSAEFLDTLAPNGLVRAFAWTIVPAELLIGFAIVVGVQTRRALLAGSFLMLMLTIGVTLQQRWDIAGLQLTYFVVYALLLAGRGLNRWSIDSWLTRTRSA